MKRKILSIIIDIVLITLVLVYAPNMEDYLLCHAAFVLPAALPATKPTAI